MGDVMDLRLSVTPFPVPAFVYEDMADRVRSSNRYCHQEPELRQAITERLGVPEDHVWLTAGIDQAINVLCSRLGRNTHVFTPTYVGYSDAAHFGELKTHDSLQGDSYQIDSSHRAGASLIFVANPNNPVGMTDSSTLERLAVNNPEALVVIDEAYIDFGGDSMVGRVEELPNVCVMRSFSKSHGLAGMRIGYVVTQPHNQRVFEVESAWFAVSAPAFGAALSAMCHEDHFASMRRTIVEERTHTVDALRTQGFDVMDTGMNAVLMRFGSTEQAGLFVEAMEEQAVLVQAGNAGSNMGLSDNYVRVAVGAPEQMERFRRVTQSLVS